jgi:hypothetical protein
MFRSVLLAALGAAVVAVVSQTASAQVYYLFPGSTVEGDLERGAGFYLMGLGQYNLNTSFAYSMWTDTVLRQEAAIEAGARERARSFWWRQQRRVNAANEAYEAIRSRLSERPEPADILRGDALNVLVWEISRATRVSPSSLRAAKVAVPGGAIERAPLFLARDDVVISATRLTTRREWPLLLRGPGFDGAFSAYHRAIDLALESAGKGTLRLEAVDAVDQALVALRRRVVRLSPGCDPEKALDAETFLKDLTRAVKFLRAARAVAIFSRIEGYAGTTVGELVEFLTQSQLQFAPATTPQERELYASLHPLLASQRDLLLGRPVIRETAK